MNSQELLDFLEQYWGLKVSKYNNYTIIFNCILKKYK